MTRDDDLAEAAEPWWAWGLYALAVVLAIALSAAGPWGFAS